jgi:hypothetical protein
VKEEKKVSRAKPMTAWKWIGFYFLPFIPLIGSIIQIVLIFKWAFGSSSDLSVKGFARAQLILCLFAIIMFIGLIALIIAMPNSFDDLLAETK